MTEADLRGHLLKTFYDLRHNADGWVPTSEMNLGGTDAARRERIGLAGQHLAQARLIEWNALCGGSEGFAIGMARITGHGVDVVEKASEPRIALRLPGESDPSIAQAGTDARASLLVSPGLLTVARLIRWGRLQIGQSIGTHIVFRPPILQRPALGYPGRLRGIERLQHASAQISREPAFIKLRICT